MKPTTYETATKGYTPSKEDMENTRPKPTAFKMSGDGVFHTIQ